MTPRRLRLLLARSLSRTRSCLSGLLRASDELVTARTASVLSGAAALVAILALIVSVTDQADQIARLQADRTRSAQDSCYLLRELVVVATRPGQRAAAIAFENRTPLRNCVTYGESVLHPRRP